MQDTFIHSVSTKQILTRSHTFKSKVEDGSSRHLVRSTSAKSQNPDWRLHAPIDFKQYLLRYLRAILGHEYKNIFALRHAPSIWSNLG